MQHPLYRHILDDCSTFRQQRWLLFVIALKLNVEVRYWFFQCPHDNMVFFRPSNINFALKAATTLEHTKIKREEADKRLHFPSKMILHTSLKISALPFTST